MRKDTLRIEELSELIVSSMQDIFKDNLLAVIVFGSSVYLKEGKDIDVIVIVDEDLSIKEKLHFEYKISTMFCKKYKVCNLDVHLFSLNDFIENLEVGTFLSGLALGYKIIFDRVGVEMYILNFLKKLSKEDYVLHNEYGSWDLGFYARLTLRNKKKRRNG
ncbi:MAG: hypothetical protein J7L50_01055 [Candidatus Odinarchaeota archaeon]|nr:hypothetical protein [Candidatus Odinarchaeota archaeon]